jgi:hypothetical protein
VILVELGDGGLEREFSPCDLQALDEVGGAGEEHAPAVLDEPEADGGGQMALSAARRAEDEEVVALLEPAVAGDQRHDPGPGEHRHGGEVEAVEGLAGRQAGFCQMALDAAALTLGEFVLGEGHEEAGGGPAFLVGAFGEAGPDVPDGGQAQLAEQQAEARLVDRIGRAHAGAPSAEATVRTS